MSITRDSEGLGPASDSTARNRGFSRPHRNLLSVFLAVLGLSPRAQAPEERSGATRLSCNNRARWDPCQPRWMAVASSVQGGAPRPRVYQPFVLDLRQWSPTRSDQPASPRLELRLPREPIQLSIYLPVGSEDGTYDVQLQPSQQPSLLETRGEARLRDHVEILEVRVDMLRLAPGSYILRLRLLPADWSEYPVQLE
jgi:hypothetical protein